MESTKPIEPDDAWAAGTWNGSRRAQLRAWADLPLSRMLEAQEELAHIALRLRPAQAQAPVKR